MNAAILATLAVLAVASASFAETSDFEELLILETELAGRETAFDRAIGEYSCVEMHSTYLRDSKKVAGNTELNEAFPRVTFIVRLSHEESAYVKCEPWSSMCNSSVPLKRINVSNGGVVHFVGNDGHESKAQIVTFGPLRTLNVSETFIMHNHVFSHNTHAACTEVR